MPLPLILGMGAAAAAAVGATSGVQGAVKMKKASDTQKKAQRRHQRNLKRFEQETETTNQERWRKFKTAPNSRTWPMKKFRSRSTTLRS